MEFFDEVVIEGAGRDSRLIAKDSVTSKSVILYEEELITSYSSPSDHVRITDKRVQLTSREVFTSDVDLKAFAAAIAKKASMVNRAKRAYFAAQ